MNKTTTSMIAAWVCALLSCLAAEARAAWPMKFSDGTVVEVIGIAEQSAAEKTWWSPDGSPAADPQFQGNGSVSVGAPAGSKMLEVIVQAPAAAMKGKSLVVRAGPRFAAGLFKVYDTSGNLIELYTPVPLDRPTVALRFGLASGPEKETILWPPLPDPAPATTQPAAESLKFVSLGEENGQTVVQLKTPPGPPHGMMNNAGGGAGGAGRPVASGGVGGSGGGGMIAGKGQRGGARGGPKISDLLFADSPQEQSVTILPRGAGGQKLPPTGFEISGDGRLTLRFRCKKDQVEKVILTTRDYEWIEMQNVSTKPAAERTDVKLVPIKETTPSTGTPPPRG